MTNKTTDWNDYEKQWISYLNPLHNLAWTPNHETSKKVLAWIEEGEKLIAQVRAEKEQANKKRC